jgi:hypothetical protein
MSQILAFDIGIKNLAWCCIRKEGERYTILGWDNYNLLSDSSNVSSSAKKKDVCKDCKAKGLYEHADSLFCSRHCPLPALRDLSGNLLKKIPVLSDCKEILLKKSIKAKAKKDDIIQQLATVYCLPRLVKKVTKAMDTNLTDIHDSLRILVEKNKTLWSKSTLIGLENQPAFKNPTMKSVQTLLFATLRDILQPAPPPLKLIHAGKKVQGTTKGDEGYKDRKAGSEARATAFLHTPTLNAPEVWRAVWEKAAKKSDLADALCMCIDQQNA